MLMLAMPGTKAFRNSGYRSSNNLIKSTEECNIKPEKPGRTERTLLYIILFTVRCTERYEQTQPCFRIYSIILLEFKSCSAFQLDAHFEAADVSNRDTKYIPGDAFIIKCIDGFALTSGEKFIVLKCTGDEDWSPSVTQLPTCVQQVTTQMHKLCNNI